MSNLDLEMPRYYMSMEDGEHLNYGSYSSREEASVDAVDIRNQLLSEGQDEPKFYTVCQIVPSLDNVIQETKHRLPEILRVWVDEWINDNVEGGTEDGVIEIQDGAVAIMQSALLDVLTNHSIYLGNGAAVDCIETNFDGENSE